jgi:hypothetical protein
MTCFCLNYYEAVIRCVVVFQVTSYQVFYYYYNDYSVTIYNEAPQEVPCVDGRHPREHLFQPATPGQPYLACVMGWAQNSLQYAHLSGWSKNSQTSASCFNPMRHTIPNTSMWLQHTTREATEILSDCSCDDVCICYNMSNSCTL